MKRNLPISQKKKFKYSITFQSFDEESLEAGDSFDRGYEVEDTIDLIGDILYKAYSTYGIYMPVAFGTWESTNPLENTDFYEKGIQKYFAIHITNEDGTQISQEENDFITFILSDGHYELNKFREYAVGGIVLGSIALGIGALITYFYFKGKKGNKSGSTNNRAKSVTHTINGKDRKFPIKDAWKKEHTLENQSEDYEVPQAERFEMGGDASEHYHEVEYGEGGVARAKEVIMNKIGFNEFIADFLVSQSEKFAIWLADAILTLTTNSMLYGKRKEVIEALNKSPYLITELRQRIRLILDWLQHPVTPKQNLRELSFAEAEKKAREWHNELQVLGGDIDFTEPETNTILKKYPVNSDGIEYYWVYIDSNYCDLESSRMGHCGRTGYGNKLISLRSVKPYGKGHTISDSHVTIAYGSDGTFYQVKGKKNNKPSEKYFPYIFDLIKSIISENGVEYSKESMNFDKTNKLYNEIRVLGFNGFGSEYGAEEDYGFEDMTEKEIREIFDLKPTLFESAEDNYMLLDAGIITLDELKKIVEREPETFSSFGNQMNLYEKGIITEQPSTTFELKYDCDEVYRLLDISRDFRDDLVAEVLCGDVGELSDGFSYYYDNPSDLISNLNKENEKRVIDEIVRITKLDESVVKENGIEYYLKGEDENFSPNDDFDNIIRALASAQNQADNNDYYKYLYDAIESALNELGEVHSLNDEGVKMTIDLSNSMSLQEIAEKMDYYEFTDVEDLFKEKIGEEIDTPFLSIDDRYSPYGSSADFNEYISDTDLEQGYKKGGILRTKNIRTNKKIKNMKSTENKFADGGQIIRFDRHASMDSATRNELVEMTSYPFLLEYEVEENGQIKYDRIKSELKREGVSTEMIKNYLSGLFDGYNYSNTDAFKKQMAKLKLVDKEFYDKVMMLYEKISKYPKINVEYADGGRVTTNDGIIESFLTSNKQLKVGNLSTHFNQYDNQMLLRNYGTLIATRIGNDVSITNIKYSKTTTTITNKIRNMALQKRMNISYVDKFAEGGETQKVNLGNGEMDLDEAIKIYEEKIKAQGRVVNARDEDVLEQLKRMKNKFAEGGEASNKKQNKEKKVFSVLVGGTEVNDYYLTEEQAKNLAFEYEDDGYDDIVIEDMYARKRISQKNGSKFVEGRKEKKINSKGVKYTITSTPTGDWTDTYNLFIDRYSDEYGGSSHSVMQILSKSEADRMFEKVNESNAEDMYRIFDKKPTHKNKKFAEGGLTEHGLMEGDKIRKDYSVVYPNEKSFKGIIDVTDKDGEIQIVNLEKGIRYDDGGSVDLDYADILNVLKTKIDASIDEMPMDYENASDFKGEEVEHESRSGFIPYTDGGYQAVWFEYLSGMWGAGRNLPTKVLDVEMNRQIDYNLDTAKESFVDEFPEIVEKLGLENIDYHSLYEADYGEEAEMLSTAEMEMMGEDTIMMQVCAYYYTPENSRGFEGENTIRLFGDVNLESPYHRAGNLDDTYEVEFAFSSISELEQKMDKGIAKIISWFNGNMYNESTAEMKIRRMAEGGKVGAVSKTKIQITDGEEGRKIATRTLIKENKNGERITYELLVGVFKDKKKGYFEIYATDSDDDEYFYAEGGLWIEGGRVVDYDGVYELSEKLKPLMSALNLNSVDVFAEGGSTDDDDDSGAIQEQLDELVQDFSSEEYQAFCYEHDIEEEDAQEMSDFIYSQTNNRCKEIIQEIEDGYYAGGYDDMEVDEYAEGGKTGEKSTKKRTIKKRPKTREPKMVRQYFDDRPYSYADGGEAGNPFDDEDIAVYMCETEFGDDWFDGENYKDENVEAFYIAVHQYIKHLQGNLKLDKREKPLYEGNLDNEDKKFIKDSLKESRYVSKNNLFAEGGEVGEFEIYDEETGKTLIIIAHSNEEAEGISETIDFNDYEDGDLINVLDDIANYDAETRDDDYEKGGSVKKNKLQQARDYWKELEGQMSEKQKKFYNELLKRRQPSFEKNFNDSEIAEYINGEIIEQFGVDLGINKYQVSGVNWFKLGFKYIAYREAIEEPEFWEEMNEYAEGGNIIMPKYRVLFVDENGRELDEYFATLTQAKVRFNQYKKDKIETNIEKVIKEKDGDINYESTEYSYTPDDEDNFAEGGEVEDWMEQALDSLIKETGNEDLDITMVSDNGNEFFAGNDMEEYRVFKTEEDAEEKAIEQVREDLEENPDYFNQDWLMNYIDGRDFFEQELNEMNYSYVEDIASETSGTKYNNRLIDELVENGLMDEDDAILENAEEIADELKYDYVLLLTEEKLDEGNNGLDYFINNFGEKETLKMVINNNLIDIDEASRDAVETDGIAHFISSYDGRTLYLLNNNVAYRNN